MCSGVTPIIFILLISSLCKSRWFEGKGDAIGVDSCKHLILTRCGAYLSGSNPYTMVVPLHVK